MFPGRVDLRQHFSAVQIPDQNAIGHSNSHEFLTHGERSNPGTSIKQRVHDVTRSNLQSLDLAIRAGCKYLLAIRRKDKLWCWIRLQDCLALPSLNII